MNFLAVRIGGVYLRIADAHWVDPVDASFAARDKGQRWNPPGVQCLYTNNDRLTARANLQRRLRGRPYERFLDPATAPVLVEVEIPAGNAADAFTDQGLAALGLPATCPRRTRGAFVPRQECQPIGRADYDADFDGIDCRSAADGGNRELA